MKKELENQIEENQRVHMQMFEARHREEEQLEQTSKRLEALNATIAQKEAALAQEQQDKEALGEDLAKLKVRACARVCESVRTLPPLRPVVPCLVAAENRKRGTENDKLYRTRKTS